MAEHRRVDEYGNPILKVDEYGNPIHGESHGTGGYGTGTGAYGTGAGIHGTGTGIGTHGTGTGTGTYDTGLAGTGAQHQPERTKEGHGISGVLHRSGSSSSSSSSEDDGMGGRRKKKSIKEKIKEKLPGTHKSEEGKTPTTTPITSTGTGGHGYGTTGTGGHGYGTTGEHGYGGTGTTATGEHEKKGIMEKIKEKLPGHH